MEWSMKFNIFLNGSFLMEWSMKFEIFFNGSFPNLFKK